MLKKKAQKKSTKLAESLKPILNWAKFCFLNLVQVWKIWKKFGELVSFIIRQTFTLRTCFRQFDELRQSCVKGPKCLLDMLWELFIKFDKPCDWNQTDLLWKRKWTTLGQWDMDDGMNDFSCFRGKWSHLRTCGLLSLSVGPSWQRLLSKEARGHMAWPWHPLLRLSAKDRW